jgi:hypothetical protein
LICRGDLHGFCVAVMRDLEVPLEGEVHRLDLAS